VSPDAIRHSVLPTLLRDEGVRLKQYRCSRGKLTIGAGRNLEDNGISHDEAMFFLQNDIDSALADCLRVFPWFKRLDDVRAGVVVQMVFQMGINGVLEFRKFCAAMSAGNYQAAADEMLDSQWARTDSPARATRHAVTMRRG
jgi:lysozyme